MKKKSLLSLLFLLMFFGIAKAETIQIGSGTETPEAGIPLSSVWKYCITQQIYSIAEIGKTGTIDSIAFYMVNSPAGNTDEIKTRTIDIYLTKTNKSVFSNASEGIAVTESEKVFSGTVGFIRDAWTMIALDTPFQYDGSANLCVTMNDRTGNFSGSSPFWLIYEGTNQVIRLYNDKKGAYDPTSPSSWTDNSEYYNLDSRKDQIKLAFSDGGSKTPIHSVNVNGYESPVAGENATDHLNITLPSDANYNFETTPYWYNDDEYENFTGTFVAGIHYSLGMTLRANDGYYFADDCTFYLNGSTELVDNAFTLVNSEDNTMAYFWSVSAAATEGSGSGSDVIEIGSGAATSNNLPTNTYYKYSLTQQLYTKEEMGGGKIINSVSFFNTGSAKTRNISVYLTQTDRTSFSSGNDWVDYNDYDKVFSGEVVFASKEWTTIPFDKSFRYLGTNSLALIVEDHTGSYVSSVPFLVFDGSNQAIRVYNDNHDYNYNYLSSYNGTLLSQKNQVKFNDVKPYNIAVSDITYESATVTWKGPGNKWNLEYKKQYSDSWNVVSGLTTRSYNLNSLSQEYTYDVRVQIDNGDGTYSDYASAQFTTPQQYARPTDVTALSVAPHSAVLDWTENCDATSWQICVDNNFGTYTIVDKKPYVLTGLTQGMTHQVCVRSIIDSEHGIYSNWSYNCEFTTPLNNPIPEISSVTTGPHFATITWEGQSDSYEVRYRKKGEGTTSLFFEDFENSTSLPSGWKALDADDDGYNWEIKTGSSYAYVGENYASSASYNNTAGALTPDNWLITPKITLGTKVSAWLRGRGSDYASEHFAFYVSTTGTNPSDFVKVSPEYITTGEYEQYTADLSDYTGQEGYIAIRHYNVRDMFELHLDYFGVYNIQWETIETTEKTMTINGLDSNTEFEFEVVGIMAGQMDAPTTTSTFKTLADNPIPFDVVVTPTATTARIEWTGYSDSYIVYYRERNSGATFFEDFDSSDNLPAGWLSLDADDDGYKWLTFPEVKTLLGYTDDSSFATHSGDGLVTSASFINNIGALTPDNWLITPQVTLGNSVSAWLRGQDPNYAEEHFAFYVSTTGTNPSDFTMVSPEYVTTDEYEEYTADLSDYTGQKGYVAVRHFNITDKYWLNLDDFGILSDGAEAEWQNANTMYTSIVIPGLKPNTEYEFKIVGYISGYSPASAGIFSFTTEDNPASIALDNNGNNKDAISENDGVYADVTINNLTFEKGKWQAVSLPFDLDVEHSILAGADVRTLESETFVENNLFLNFLTPVTKMKAGMPYIVKWNKGTNLSNPTFNDVTMVNVVDDETPYCIRFDYSAFNVALFYPFTSDDDYDQFLKLSGTTGTDLKLIKNGDTLKAFEPYFYIPAFSYYDEVYLNLGQYNDLITGVSSLGETEEGAAIYNLAGQRLAKTQKGINIVNGKKILIK